MATGSDSTAAKIVADSDLPSFDDVFDNTSWESRLAKARVDRENAIADREKSKNDTKEAAEGLETGDGAEIPTVTTGENVDGSLMSMNAILETGNLKERLELAQKRNAQVQEKQGGNSPAPGFAFSRNSTAEFKKVVLYAKTSDAPAGTTPASPGEGHATVYQLPMVIPTPVAQENQPFRRRAMAVGLLLAAFAAGLGSAYFVMRSDSTEIASTGAVVDPVVPVAITPTGDGAVVASTAEVASAVVLARPIPAPVETPVAVVAETFTAPANAGFQPTELNGPAFAIQTPTRPEITLASAAGPRAIAPLQPDFLGGARQSVQLSSLRTPPLGRFRVEAQMNAAFTPRVLVPQNLASLSLGAGIAKYTPQAAPVTVLATPVTLFATPVVPEIANPVTLLIAAPLAGPTPEIDLAGQINSNAASWGDAAQVNIASLPILASLGHGDIPSFGNAPAPIAPTPLGKLLPAHSISVFAPANLSETVTGEVMSQLEDAGFDTGVLKSVGFRISSNNVRYYHSADAETALVLAELTNAKVRDFTSFSPSPARGTVELWLEGTAPKALRRLTRRSQAGSSNSDPALRALRDRLVQRLQRGDHLGGG